MARTGMTRAKGLAKAPGIQKKPSAMPPGQLKKTPAVRKPSPPPPVTKPLSGMVPMPPQQVEEPSMPYRKRR